MNRRNKMPIVTFKVLVDDDDDKEVCSTAGPSGLNFPDEKSVDEM